MSSLVLVGAAWTWRWALRGGPVAFYGTRLAFGMTFGFVGDLCMAAGSIIGGLLFFGIGHGFYIAAMLRLARERGYPLDGRRHAAWALWLLVGGLLWYFLVFHGEGGSGSGATLLISAGLVYTLLLASTSGVASGLAAWSWRFLPVALGGAFFLASDGVIAARMFHPPAYAAIPEWVRGDLVWLTYGPAQMLIVWSAGTAARVGKSPAIL